MFHSSGGRTVTGESSFVPVEWQEPYTPWKLLTIRILPGDFDAASFAKKYGIDQSEIDDLISGKTRSFSEALCRALSQETNLSFEMMKNLSDRDAEEMAKRG